MTNGKGDKRREEDRKRIDKNWPFKKQQPKVIKQKKGERQ